MNLQKMKANVEKVNCIHCGTANPVTSKYCSDCGYELPGKEVEQQPAEPVKSVPPGRKLNWKKIIGLFAGIIVFGLSYFAVQKIFFRPPSFDQTLMKVAGEINKSCPLMVDSDTRLDNTIALPGNILQYNYTLVNMDKASTDTIGLRNYIEPIVVNNIKTNPQMKFMRDNKTTLNYYYKDKNGEYLFLVAVTPELYQ